VWFGAKELTMTSQQWPDPERVAGMHWNCRLESIGITDRKGPEYATKKRKKKYDIFCAGVVAVR
jgi:hypothetical protein